MSKSNRQGMRGRLKHNAAAYLNNGVKRFDFSVSAVQIYVMSWYEKNIMHNTVFHILSYKARNTTQAKERPARGFWSSTCLNLGALTLKVSQNFVATSAASQHGRTWRRCFTCRISCPMSKSFSLCLSCCLHSSSLVKSGINQGYSSQEETSSPV